MRTALGRRWHLHWFQWAGVEWLDDGSVYACRCGKRRPGL